VGRGLALQLGRRSGGAPGLVLVALIGLHDLGRVDLGDEDIGIYPRDDP